MIFNEHIKKTLLNEYAGSQKKKTVILDDGNKYLLKFPDPARKIGLELSYINNSISEYISCHIFNIIGIPVQKTILGEYIDEKGNTKIACACQDVRKNGETMYEINKLELSSLDNTHTKKLSLSYMDEVFNRMDSILPKEQLSEFYYKMLIVDIFTGNTDRHNGNWAIIQGQDGIRISPVYDCGSSLAPLVGESKMSSESGVFCAKNTNSVLVDDNGKSIKYYDFFNYGITLQEEKALKSVMPNVNLDKIDRLILDIPYISAARKDFYTSFLHTTYECILLPAIEKCLLQPENKFSDLPGDKCYDFYKQVIRPLKNSATYEKQSLGFIGLSEYQYSKAGKSHLFIYKNDKPVGMISTRSNNRDSRLNFAKFMEYGLDMKNIKDRNTVITEQEINNQHCDDEYDIEYDDHDDR